jgi:SAM-dependent methyltransferase
MNSHYREAYPDCRYGIGYTQDPYVRQRYQIAVKLLHPYLRSGTAILDIGGYSGDILELLPEGVKYCCIDIDKKALELAKKRGAITKVVDLDYEPLHLEGELFNIIMCIEVLEHLKNPGRILEQIPNLLIHDGIVLISLPNENTIYHRILSLLGFGLDQEAFNIGKHLHFPTIKQSRVFLSRYFSIFNHQYYISVSGRDSKIQKISFIFKLLPDRFWYFLARVWPSLFARGTIFSCRPKKQCF